MASEPAKKTATVPAGVTSAKITAFPLNYFDDPKVDLHAGQGQSIDEVGAKANKGKQNVPLNYVEQMQNDLIALGYLSGKADGAFGAGVERAVKRFQRHAARTYRWNSKVNGPDDVADSGAFKGPVTGHVDKATADEIQRWKKADWVLPIGRFHLSSVNKGNARFRFDATPSWDKITDKIIAKGIPFADDLNLGKGKDGKPHILSAFTDAPRPITVHGTTGSSSHSFHYCGRAVDILGRSNYFLLQEPSGGQTFWRILAKMPAQNGDPDIKQIDNSDTSKKHFQWSGPEDGGKWVAAPLPSGFYFDVTEAITGGGDWERIPAQPGFETVFKKAEWWHFQYKLEKQATFQDECELIGITEKQLRDQIWKTDADLDAPPG